MISRKTTIELSSDARSHLAALLRSAEGQNILDALAATCPKILDAGTSEVMLASAHQHKGWEDCVEQLINFGLPETPVAEQTAGNYPDLDKDEAWPKEETVSE